jgi:hypothetical protein
VVTLATTPQGRIFAGTMLDGIVTSENRGLTWEPYATGLARLGVVWQMIPIGNELLVATDNGVLTRTT